MPVLFIQNEIDITFLHAKKWEGFENVLKLSTRPHIKIQPAHTQRSTAAIEPQWSSMRDSQGAPLIT